MFNDITQRMEAYYDEIPSNTFPTIAKAIVFSFTVTLFSQGQVEGAGLDFYARPLIAAGIGAVATLIHALVTPIFNAAFENNHQVILYQELVKTGIVVGLTRILACCVTGQRVDILATTKLSMLSTNLIKSLFHLLPQMYSYIDPAVTFEARDILNSWGLDTPHGANSTYLVF